MVGPGEKTNGELLADLVRREGFARVVALYQKPYQEFYFNRAGVTHLEKEFDVRRVLIRDWEKEIGAFNQEILVYFLPGLGPGTARAYRALGRRGGRILARFTDPVPVPTRRMTPTVRATLKWTWQRMISSGRHRPADFFLGSGTESYAHPPVPIEGAERIPGHASDYDTLIHLAREGKLGTMKEEHLLFIDSSDFRHQDLANIGIAGQALAWEQAYYRRINGFFDLLEREYGLPVKVAAHPVGDTSRRFGNREVIRGRTAELVRDAKFVLVHQSTAVNIAVILRKPVVFVTDADYHDYFIGPLIDASARELGKKPLWLEDPQVDDVKRNLAVDGGVYAEYQRKFIGGAS